MKLSDLSEEQTKLLARKMGYSGPMHKFHEFVQSAPKKMATGGLVTNAVSSIADNLANRNAPATDPVVAPTVAVTPQVVGPGELVNHNAGGLPSEIRPAPTAVATATTATTPADITTSTVDPTLTQPGVEDVVNKFESAQGTVSEKSTVKGQLSSLMKDFEGGEVPAWAAGAIRQANTVMAQRGISSSSMAGQAVLQAAMESALPIASQDAQANLQMDLANLSNEQQTLMAKNSGRLESFFTDAAAENAAKQFNASSENQTKQFISSLRSQTDQFNVSQRNAMNQFNAGETNARSLFVANMRNQRQQFQATNRMVIDQANAAWRRTVSTQNNATINEANRIDAASRLEMSISEMNNSFQERRDIMNFAFTAGENEKDRSTELLLANMSSDEAEKSRDSASRDAMFSAAGSLLATIWRQ